MALINAKNSVPQNQRLYQNAYRAHTRLWQIGHRSRWMIAPYVVLLWGSLGASLYAGGRKVAGYNTWFGPN